VDPWTRACSRRGGRLGAAAPRSRLAAAGPRACCIGSDTGGSIQQFRHAFAVHGMKPPMRITPSALGGVVPLVFALTLDSLGPLTITSKTAALLTRCHGWDRRARCFDGFPSQGSISPRRLRRWTPTFAGGVYRARCRRIFHPNDRSPLSGAPQRCHRDAARARSHCRGRRGHHSIWRT